MNEKYSDYDKYKHVNSYFNGLILDIGKHTIGKKDYALLRNCGVPFVLDKEKVLEVLNCLKNTYNEIDKINELIARAIDEEAKNYYVQKEKVEKKPQPGYIYIAMCTNSNLCKIGKSKNHPKTRVSQIRTHNVDVELYYYFYTKDMSLEQKLHCDYKNNRITETREWFNLTEKEIDEIIEKYNPKLGSLNT